MAGKGRTGIRIVILLFAAVLGAQVCVPAAFAEDEELMKELPGQWVLEDDAGDEGEETRQYEAASLALEGDGKMSLRFSSPEGEYLYTCEGTWTSELVPGGLDRSGRSAPLLGALRRIPDLPRRADAVSLPGRTENRQGTSG